MVGLVSWVLGESPHLCSSSIANRNKTIMSRKFAFMKFMILIKDKPYSNKYQEIYHEVKLSLFKAFCIGSHKSIPH